MSTIFMGGGGGADHVSIFWVIFVVWGGIDDFCSKQQNIAIHELFTESIVKQQPLFNLLQ